MKPIDSILFKIFSIGLPVISLIAWWASSLEGPNENGLYNLAGFALMFYCVISMIFFVRVILSKPLREEVLKKILFFKERDEREKILTAEASKSTFFASLAILFVVLFFSCFQLSIYKVEPRACLQS